jgi:hypothetical protein
MEPDLHQAATELRQGTHESLVLSEFRTFLINSTNLDENAFFTKIDEFLRFYPWVFQKFRHIYFDAFKLVPEHLKTVFNRVVYKAVHHKPLNFDIDQSAEELDEEYILSEEARNEGFDLNAYELAPRYKFLPPVELKSSTTCRVL